MCGFLTLESLNNNNLELFNISGFTRINNNNILSDLLYNLENVQVLTDGGLIDIDKINPDIHTIKNKKIVGLTKTVSLDKFLICFEKDSIDKNIPNKKTILSKKQKVYCNEKFIEAINLINNENIIKINYYDNKILYNILMENYNTMTVNNMIVDTLHPKNIVAQLYLLNSY
jgi:type V secretory pathway adhesin AidA